jgi:hypothetical protein
MNPPKSRSGNKWLGTLIELMGDTSASPEKVNTILGRASSNSWRGVIHNEPVFVRRNFETPIVLRRANRWIARARRVSPRARQVYIEDMTIPDVGRCLGSGESPREGSEETTTSSSSGVCIACSGRFTVLDGRIVQHEAAPADERETTSSR